MARRTKIRILVPRAAPQQVVSSHKGLANFSPRKTEILDKEFE